MSLGDETKSPISFLDLDKQYFFYFLHPLHCKNRFKNLYDSTSNLFKCSG